MTHTTPSSFSSRYQLFLWISAALVLANLLIMNDWMAIWEPWEKVNLEMILGGQSEGQSMLPQSFLSLFFNEASPALFWLRLPGVLILLLGLGLGFWIGKPIFGQKATMNTGLVLTTSFALLFSTKLAAYDVWLFTTQLLTVLSMLRFLKQPSWRWGAIFWLFALLGLWTHTWSMAISILTLGTYLMLLHPQGKGLWKLGFWGLAIGLFFSSASLDGFIFSYGNMPFWLYLAILIGGFLPWIGFLLAAFPDLLYKLRKKEEMAIILTGMLLAGLAAQSLLLCLVFALLIARQIDAYFQANYPYPTVVRGFAIVHLLFSFLLISGGLLFAFSQIGALGFRSIMAAGAIYWMCTFVAVIGLFGNQRALIIAGMTWGALLTFFLFWVRTFVAIEEVVRGMIG